MSDMPGNPFTELAIVAAQLHEMYTELVQAGFSMQEALYLTGEALKGAGGR